ncbi:MAG: hypothetical protein U0521_27205 [Anaerolineae bacterium]
MEEHQPELAHHRVEAARLERQDFRFALPPLDLWCFSRGDRQHVIVQVETHDRAARPDAPGGSAGENARTARNVEDTLTGLKLRRVSNARCPFLKQCRDQEFVVDFGRAAARLCAIRIAHQVSPNNRTIRNTIEDLGRGGEQHEAGACRIVSPEASFNTGHVFDVSGGRTTNQKPHPRYARTNRRFVRPLSTLWRGEW